MKRILTAAVILSMLFVESHSQDSVKKRISLSWSYSPLNHTTFSTSNRVINRKEQWSAAGFTIGLGYGTPEDFVALDYGISGYMPLIIHNSNTPATDKSAGRIWQVTFHHRINRIGIALGTGLNEYRYIEKSNDNLATTYTMFKKSGIVLELDYYIFDNFSCNLRYSTTPFDLFGHIIYAHILFVGMKYKLNFGKR